MALIKLFVVPQRSVKILFKLFFILNFFFGGFGTVSVYVNTLPFSRVNSTSFTLQSFENENAEE